jgi:hypothetical protein
VRGGWTRNTARTDRWKREDEAPRLREEVPNLDALRMELEELQEDRPIAGTRRVRHFVVAHAAARFEIPCGEEKCEGGGHDLTAEILGRLRAREGEFEGSSNCRGTVRERLCDRTLSYQASAKYLA